MWAFLCATAPFVCSQTTTPSNPITEDSIEYSLPPQLLDEITVQAAQVSDRTDEKTIRPNKEMLRTSADGIDLLRKLQLSRISVNPMTNDVEVRGGGKATLCINGVEATQSQIAAIDPKDIRKIEYHDSPGTRYSDSAVVIDYITERHESGGNIFLNSFGAFGNDKWASIENFAAQYNHGRSVWTANAAYFGKRSGDWIRDYDEIWRYPDTDVTRHEDGLPVTSGNHYLESTVNYNHMHPSGDILNIRLGFNLNDVPNLEQGDRKALLSTSDSEQSVLIMEHTEEHSIQPNAGLYYQHRISDNRSLTVDAQGSYIRSRMLHEYSENETAESSRVKGNSYAFKLLGMYENRIGSRVWNVGVSHNSSFLRNNYLQDIPFRVGINQSETALMGEYSDNFGRLGVIGRLRGVYRHLGQDKEKLDRLFLLPNAVISYRPWDKWTLRYSASLDYKMPAAAEISDVEQPIQPGMVRRGNPELKPFRVIDQSLDISFEHHLISINPRIEYRNEHKPVMESVIMEDGLFGRTYFNQRSFQRLMAGGSVSMRPWEDHLSVAVEPILTRYFSHGLDYSHCHNIFRVGLSVDFSYGNWIVYGNIMSGPDNYMYGEEIIEEEDMNQIMVGYRRDKWSIQAGLFDAFSHYWMESRNLSALTPYTSKAHHGRNSSFIALRFNLKLDFGRKTREVLSIDNEIDSDSGILTGTK